jgi:hypothetical protein
MKEHSIPERLLMILRVIISIVSWVVLILVKIVRNMLPIGSKDQPGRADSGTAHW